MLQTFRPQSTSSSLKEGIYNEPDDSSCQTCSVESAEIPGELSGSSPECPIGHYDIPLKAAPFPLSEDELPEEERYTKLSVLSFSAVTKSELVEEKGTYRFGDSFGAGPCYYSASAAFDLAPSNSSLPTSSTPILRFHRAHPCPSSNDLKSNSLNGYMQEPFTDPLQLTELQAKPVRSQCAKLWKNASMLYGVFLSTTSISLTLASNLTHNINSVYARWFNVAMTSIGICFLVLCYFLLIRKRKSSKPSLLYSQRPRHLKLTFRRVFNHQPDLESTTTDRLPDQCPVKPERSIGSPSFYHSLGALVFAIGSLVYTCLEVGVYVENRACLNIVKGVEPGLFAVFLTMQLYLIFQISQLRLSTAFHYAICWFGLIHLVATDLSVWVRILFDETHHAISLVAEKEARSNHTSWLMGDIQGKHGEHLTADRDPPFTEDSYAPLCLNEESLMQDLLERASIFLYPCLIEYTLITADVIFTGWQVIGADHHNVNQYKPHLPQVLTEEPAHQRAALRRRRTRYSIDWDQAAKGFFCGMITLVLTVVGIVLFFVFIDKDKGGEGVDDATASLIAVVMSIVLNAMALFATVYCMRQFIKYIPKGKLQSVEETDARLLNICMTGVYAFSVISIIGTRGGSGYQMILSLVDSIVRLVGTTLQTVFIMEAGTRLLNPKSNSPPYLKHGRETLTFLLLLNFGLWAVDVFCMMQRNVSSAQRDFFGAEQWTLIIHLTVPLLIFYRFHSAACLVDIWKRAYKVKHVPKGVRIHQ